jgi:hypothetical protein
MTTSNIATPVLFVRRRKKREAVIMTSTVVERASPVVKINLTSCLNLANVRRCIMNEVVTQAETTLRIARATMGIVSM